MQKFSEQMHPTIPCMWQSPVNDNAGDLINQSINHLIYKAPYGRKRRWGAQQTGLAVRRPKCLIKKTVESLAYI